MLDLWMRGGQQCALNFTSMCPFMISYTNYNTISTLFNWPLIKFWVRKSGRIQTYWAMNCYRQAGREGGVQEGQNIWGPDWLGGSRLVRGTQYLGETSGHEFYCHESWGLIMHNHFLILGPDPGSCQPCLKTSPCPGFNTEISLRCSSFMEKCPWTATSPKWICFKNSSPCLFWAVSRLLLKKCYKVTYINQFEDSISFNTSIFLFEFLFYFIQARCYKLGL